MGLPGHRMYFQALAQQSLHQSIEPSDYSTTNRSAQLCDSFGLLTPMVTVSVTPRHCCCCQYQLTEPVKRVRPIQDRIDALMMWTRGWHYRILACSQSIMDRFHSGSH
jgi:hypothetical protein